MMTNRGLRQSLYLKWYRSWFAGISSKQTRDATATVPIHLDCDHLDFLKIDSRIIHAYDTIYPTVHKGHSARQWIIWITTFKSSLVMGNGWIIDNDECIVVFNFEGILLASFAILGGQCRALLDSHLLSSWWIVLPHPFDVRDCTASWCVLVGLG